VAEKIGLDEARCNGARGLVGKPRHSQSLGGESDQGLRVVAVCQSCFPSI